MGQSPSINAAATATPNRRRDNSVKDLRSFLTENDDVITTTTTGDISILPDACLACVFQFLTSGDRKTCSLVSKRWLEIEGQSRHRLSLNAHSDLTTVATSLFSRFDSVTKLSLKCDRRSVSIGDDGLVLISEHCRNLTRLKLRACREITDLGVVRVSENLKYLKRFSCGSCSFGVKGMNGLIHNCNLLEELSVKRLRGISNGGVAESVGPGGMSLKFVCLKDLYNAQCFGDLLVGSKNLRMLKVFRCSGDWDKLIEMVTESVSGLVEVHLERLQLSDVGLAAVAKCRSLEVLHILKTPDCSNLGLLRVAENCRGLRKVHIDGWKTNRINDEGLVGLSKYCVNIQELVLIGVNCTRVGLEVLGANCVKLERLALCGSETVGDAEISCIAEKCIALKKLCIKSCPVSDHGMEALAGGCPNLVKVKVKKCRGVTSEGLSSLRASRESLTVNLDSTEVESQDAASEGVLDGVVEIPTVTNRTEGASNSASRSTSRSTSFKARLGIIAGRSLVSCTFRKWSSFGGSSSRSQCLRNDC